MIFARMSRPIKVLVLSSAAAAAAALVTACGSEKIAVPKSDPTYAGAVLFSQRCSGCHTLSYAATHGSAANVRTRDITNGPNFNVRCERPVTRVLYAIENGGFSGAIMPQNVVVGPDAVAVAQFVAKYAGRQAPKTVGQPSCESQPIGSVPGPVASIAAGAGTSTGAQIGVLRSTPATSTTASGATTPSGTSGKQPARRR
jgi:mono/diheme cytochrome c family protein